MWRREPAVAQLIKDLDRYAELPNWGHMSREERLDRLQKGEWDAVVEQQEACTSDFVWAAKNYFWITDNDGNDILLDLWHAQYLILQLWYDLKSQGKPQKIYCVKGRQIGACLDPETKVLTGDLRWVRIDDVGVGQELVAVDEESPGGKGNSRKMRRATVVARNDVEEPAFRIVMDNGGVLIATAQHRFLCKNQFTYVSKKKRASVNSPRFASTCWKQVEDLKVGDGIRFTTAPWEEAGYEDGWMGGMMDGEASLRGPDRGSGIGRGGSEIVISQKDNPAYRRAVRYLTERGYTFRVDSDERTPDDSSKFGRERVFRICVERTKDIFRLVGLCRPSRFIGRQWWDGMCLPGQRSSGISTSYSKVVSIEPLGIRRMVDLQTTTGTFIAEGFVSHNSILIEAMVAWSTIFFPNTEALVVSVDEDHSSYLFGLMLHIYDHLPWWLKPEVAEREEKYGIKFDRKDAEKRALEPGLNSKISVQYSTQVSGVGQGRKILSFHGSELTDWFQPKARRIVEGDLLHAIKDTPRAFAFLETTGKEAGSYSHKLWRKCEKLAELSEWYPLFLPWFFEPGRRRTVTVDWSPKKPELSMRERVRNEWVRCQNAQCGRYMGAAIHGASRDGQGCPFCGVGILMQVVLTDEQLYWKEIKRRNAQETDSESYKEHLVELATTAEESFQLQGLAVFDSACQEAVTATIIDPDKTPGVKRGYFDHQKRFHGLDGTRPCADDYGRTAYRCYLDGCNTNHMADLEHFNVTIWEEPQQDAAYSIGVDIAEGIGQDYSVIFVNKFGRFGRPDEQVAMLRDNRMEPLDLAFYCVLFGMYYNEALLAIEYNGIGKVCADAVRHVYQYSNLYRWKHLDSTQVLSNKWHWYTKPDTREKLWQTARKWIKAGSWIIRSKEFLAEMESFQKDEDDSKSAGHGEGDHDDILFCLPGGTSITTIRGQKNIEDVKVGDLVLTHKGRYMPVMATGSRIEKERLYRIAAYGKPELLLTGNHAMYLWKRYRQLRAPADVPFIKAGNKRKRFTRTKAVCRTKHRQPEWISVDSAKESLSLYATCGVADTYVRDVESIDLSSYCPYGSVVKEVDELIGFSSGDLRTAQARIQRHVPVDKNFLRFLGYYLAEGSKGQHNIVFASHRREEPITRWLKEYLESLGLHCGVRPHAQNGTVLWSSSVVMRAFVDHMREKDKKRLPNWTRFLPPEKQREILVGYLLGDGSFRMESGAISAATISREAAFQIYQMSLRCGWAVAMRQRPAQACGNYDPWILAWSGTTADEIKRHIEPELLACKRPTSHSKTFSTDNIKLQDGYVLSQIRKSEPVEFTGVVYDLTVAQDHSFVANGTVVSNSGFISLYCGHESEADERGVIHCPMVEERVAVPRFQMICLSCQGQHEESVAGGGPEVPYEWPADDPASSFQCPRCFSHRVIGKPLETHDPRGKVAEVGFNLDGSISLNAKAVIVSPGEMPMGLDDL